MPLLVSLGLVDDAPDVPLPVVLDEPDEDPLEGVWVVVVVVVVVPELPDEPDVPLLPEVAAESDFVGSPIVVVVVVWPKVNVAVPSSDRKIAIGNFFMLAP